MKKIVFWVLIFTFVMHDFSYLKAGNGAGWGFLGGFGAGALTTLAISKARSNRRTREPEVEYITTPRYVPVTTTDNREIQRLRSQIEAQERELQKLKSDSQQKELERIREKYKNQKEIYPNSLKANEQTIESLSDNSENLQKIKNELQEKFAQIEEIEKRFR